MKIACRNLNLDIKAPLSKSVYHRELIINFMLGARGEFLNDSGNDNGVNFTMKTMMSLIL